MTRPILPALAIAALWLVGALVVGEPDPTIDSRTPFAGATAATVPDSLASPDEVETGADISPTPVGP